MSDTDAEAHDVAWYEGVLNSMSDMVLVKGDRSKLLWANKAFLEYYGMTNQELLDIVDAEHSDPDDTIQYVKDDHFVYSTGRRLDVMSEPVTSANGETAYFHTVKNAVFERNKVLRTVGVSRPIESADVIEASQRSRHEQKSSLRELRTFVRNIPLAVAMFDVQQRFVTYSDHWPESLGYTGETLVGQFFSTSFEAQLPIQDQLDLVIRTGEPKLVESLVVQRSGAAKLIADVVINPWQLPTGDIGGCIAIIHDMTDVTNSRRNLERVNDELTQFNYRVSHDLVAPLRTVRGYLDIALDEIDENPALVRGMLGTMTARIDQLSELVRDVMDLARADARDETLAPVNVADLVGEVIDAHTNEIDSAAIEVTCSQVPITINSNRTRLRQILDNLVANAIKYHDPAKPTRSLDVHYECTDRDLRLAVRDKGTGLDDDIVGTAFDLFVRGTSKHPGSGLGLYLVRKHAEALGGSVLLTSPRNATEFVLEVPLDSVH